MVYAEQGALDLESELREHFQQEATRDLEAFDRRLRAIEHRLGIVTEAAYGPGQLLAAEGEELTADEVAGIAPATGFGTFGFGRGVLGAEKVLRDALTTETGQPKQRGSASGDVLRPEDVAGMPLARNFQ